MMSSDYNHLEIDFDRFLSNFEVSSNIGKVKDVGLNRLALTNEDKEIRDFFIEYMKNIGLKVRVDDIGNVYGRKEGIEDASPVLIGSHLDTQPYGGRYDGVVGVLLGLEVIETLIKNNIETKRPIEIVNFTNEEGARFSPPMMASGALSGEFTNDFVYSRHDKNDKSFGEELEKIGYKGSEENRIKDIYAYIEAHIEQGPVLENENKDIGVVTGIQGMSWFEIELIGNSNHAGTTPMKSRKDPILAASEIIYELEKIANEKDIKLTIGRWELTPNVPNVIPENVKFTLDIRSNENSLKQEFIQEMDQLSRNISKTRRVGYKLNELWESPTAYFDENIIHTIETQADMLQYKFTKIMSGAGHDAKYINDIAPTAMMFMPSQDGISHDIKEYTSDKFMNICGNLLLQVILELSNK